MEAPLISLGVIEKAKLVIVLLFFLAQLGLED